MCVFANKKDRPGAKTAAEITELLGLTSMKVPMRTAMLLRARVTVTLPPQDRQWTIQATSAVQGEGLSEGMDWLANVLAAQQ